MISKFKYFFQSAVKHYSNQKNICPFCYNPILKNAEVIDKKYVLVKLIKCPGCSLLVRVPTDSINENKNFYQEEYSQGYTTDCPDETQLNHLISTKFKNSERDYSSYIALLESLNIKKGSTVLDFGCSWGYGVYQLSNAGYIASGYEISKPRLQFGVDKLNIDGVTEVDHIPDKLDVFFSAHVLEHVPDLKAVFDLAKKVLKPGGFFIAITPNGSAAFKKNMPGNFHHLWGKVHPILLSDEFVFKNFPEQLKLIGSFPLEKPFVYNSDSVHIEKADKWELAFIIQNI